MLINIETSIHTRSGTMTYAGEPVMKYEINVPELWSSTPGVQRVNSVYAADLKAKESYCRGDFYKMAVQDATDAVENGFPVKEYEFLKTFDVTCNEECVLSLYHDTYVYSGGAHGNTERTSETWRFPEGRKITLESLMPKGAHYRAAIIARIIAVISRNPEPYFDDYKKLVIESFKPESFYLTPDGIAFYFQQYEIAPYSSGIPVFEFSYDAIGAVKPRCPR